MIPSIKNIDIERIREMTAAALCIDGSHHKQYYLIEIAKELNIPAKTWDYTEEGIAP